jgi:hypothetical protein
VRAGGLDERVRALLVARDAQYQTASETQADCLPPLPFVD